MSITTKTTSKAMNAKVKKAGQIPLASASFIKRILADLDVAKTRPKELYALVAPKGYRPEGPHFRIDGRVALFTSKVDSVIFKHLYDQIGFIDCPVLDSITQEHACVLVTLGATPDDGYSLSNIEVGEARS